MTKKRKNISIIVLLIAVIVNIGIYVVASNFDLSKLNEISQKYLKIDIVEKDALVDNNKSKDQTNKVNQNSTIATELKNNLHVHFIDVGQGDSILIEQDGHFMLIDAGPTGSKEIVKSYLEKMNVKKLDYIIVSHNHEDHIGGMANVINSFDAEKIIISKNLSTTKTYENMINAAKKKNLKFTAPTKGEMYNFAGSSFTILADGTSGSNNVNNQSIVIKLTYGKNSFLFTGDAEEEIELEIISSGLDCSADVLKLGHHGSNTSSSKQFIAKVNPEYGVISCGKNNMYGHPCKSVMQTLKSNNIIVYRTDESSHIVATSDGDKITFNVQPGTYSFISAK